MFELDGKTALVTGATRGIGEASARALDIAGARVILSGRTTNDLIRVASELKNEPVILEADLSPRGAGSRHAEQVLEATQGEGVNIIVNNAGIPMRRSPEALSEEDEVQVINAIETPQKEFCELVFHLTDTERLLASVDDEETLVGADESGEEIVMMNNNSFDQETFSKGDLGDSVQWMEEGQSYEVLLFKGSPLSVELETFVEIEVTETEPGFKGDTATGATKPAILKNGVEVKVPLFIEIGDILKIDTRTGEYQSRAKD